MVGECLERVERPFAMESKDGGMHQAPSRHSGALQTSRPPASPTHSQGLADCVAGTNPKHRPDWMPAQSHESTAITCHMPRPLCPMCTCPHATHPVKGLGPPVKGQVHAAHGVQRALGYSHHCINVARVALTWLHHLQPASQQASKHTPLSTEHCTTVSCAEYECCFVNCTKHVYHTIQRVMLRSKPCHTRHSINRCLTHVPVLNPTVTYKLTLQTRPARLSAGTATALATFSTWPLTHPPLFSAPPPSHPVHPQPLPTSPPHLCWCIIVWDVEPQAVADGSGHALPQAEGVATHKVSALPVRVVQAVEVVGGGGRQQVLQVLLQGVDVLW